MNLNAHLQQHDLQPLGQSDQDLLRPRWKLAPLNEASSTAGVLVEQQKVGCLLQSSHDGACGHMGEPGRLNIFVYIRPQHVL